VCQKGRSCIAAKKLLDHLVGGHEQRRGNSKSGQ